MAQREGIGSEPDVVGGEAAEDETAAEGSQHNGARDELSGAVHPRRLAAQGPADAVVERHQRQPGDRPDGERRQLLACSDAVREAVAESREVVIVGGRDRFGGRRCLVRSGRGRIPRAGRQPVNVIIGCGARARSVGGEQRPGQPAPGGRGSGCGLRACGALPGTQRGNDEEHANGGAWHVRSISSRRSSSRPVLLFARLGGSTPARSAIYSIDFTGLKHTKPLVVTREIETAVGRPLRLDVLAADLRRLDNLGIFASVEATGQTDGDGWV
ncbi:MAG: hypothetical protein EHM24_22740 [Acidobacteria bacterium]|nr:MAG: hypothetical protein EHM24_22740 [Acidobacteriota bacterium]